MQMKIRASLGGTVHNFYIERDKRHGEIRRLQSLGFKILSVESFRPAKPYHKGA